MTKQTTQSALKMPLVAPPFSSRNFYKSPIRLAQQRWISKIKAPQPVWIPVLNVTSGLAVGLSVENQYSMAIDFWWISSSLTHVFNGIANQAFVLGASVQLYRNVLDQNGNQQTFRFQKSPVLAQNVLGIAGFDSATSNTYSASYNLTEPVFFPAGTQLVCEATILSGITSIQIVLFGLTEGS
jgi:hypothetical protein